MMARRARLMSAVVGPRGHRLARLLLVPAAAAIRAAALLPVQGYATGCPGRVVEGPPCPVRPRARIELAREGLAKAQVREVEGRVLGVEAPQVDQVRIGLPRAEAPLSAVAPASSEASREEAAPAPSTSAASSLPSPPEGVLGPSDGPGAPGVGRAPRGDAWRALPILGRPVPVAAPSCSRQEEVAAEP